MLGASERVDEIESQFSADNLITGIELGKWLRVLKNNDFQVGAEYLHRAAFISALSIPSSVFARLEDAIYGRRLAEMDVDPDPLFIVGHWRSGTTHMHNLLGRDRRHTFPTLYQVIFPGSFLLTGKVGPRLLRSALPETRTYDNVRLGWAEAAEDEIALLKTHGMSFYMALMFPDQFQDYERYIDMMQVSPDEKQIWKKSLEIFVKKIMLQTGQRVVVKSCPHSARIRLLLEMFPNAKFVHIHRNPYETFSSMVRMRSIVDWENFFHRPQKSFIGSRWEHTATIGERVYERLIEDRHLIPEENFYEVGFSDFTGNELHHLKAIYEKFGLGDWDTYKSDIDPYLESLKGYKRNKLEFPQALTDLVYERWRRVFDTYGYPKEYGT